MTEEKKKQLKQKIFKTIHNGLAILGGVLVLGLILNAFGII